MTKLMYLAATAAMMFHGSGVGQATPDQEVENAREFRALCNLIQLASKGFDSPEAKFDDKLTELGADIQRAAILAYGNETENKESAKQGAEGLKQAGSAIPQTKSGLAAAQKIKETAKAAANLISKVKDKIDNVRKATEAANKHLYKAVWGRDDEAPQIKDGAVLFAGDNSRTIFGPGDSNDRTSNCGGNQFTEDVRTNVGRTLVNDLVCLCIDGLSTMKKCADDQHGIGTKADNFKTPDGTFSTKWSNLIGWCPEQKLKVTAAAVQEALANVVALIGGNAHKKATQTKADIYILGWADDSSQGCTGNTKQVCVNYAPWSSAKQARELRWQKEVREAIEMVAPEKKDTDVDAAIDALTIMNLSVWQLYEAGFEAADAVKTETTEDKFPPMAQEECNKHKSKKTCEEKNCKWEGEDGKSETEGTCKPKDGEGQTNTVAGTEGVAAGTTANTTGNNSFVINKAPLWLAVLLF